MKRIFTSLCLSLGIAFAIQAASEPELLAVIRNDKASRNDRITACQDLGRVGTKASFETLSPLLGNPDLWHAARYALEMIPDPAVEDVLCNAAGKLQGGALLGVVQSLGNRGGARAVGILSKTLSCPDRDIRIASAYALGKIATPAALAALKTRLGQCPHVAIAYLNGASKSKDSAFVVACCEEIRGTKENVLDATRLGATVTEILISGEKGLSLWDACIAGGKNDVNAALRAVLDYPASEEATKRFAAALEKIPSVRERLCAVLGARGDKAAAPALVALTKKGEKWDCMVAADALAQLNHPAAIPALIELLNAKEKDLIAGAKKAMVGFSGKIADDAVLKLLSSPDVKMRLMAVDLVLQRRMTGAIHDVANLLSDATPSLREAVLRVLGDLGTPADAPLLIDLVMKSPAEEKVIRALSSLCVRSLEPHKGKIEISSAKYGYFPYNQVRDVTKNTCKLVSDGSIAIQATGRLCNWDGFFADPAPGKTKSLRLFYMFDGKPFSVEVRENDSHYLGGMWLNDFVAKKLREAWTKGSPAQKIALVDVYALLGTQEALDALTAAHTENDISIKEAVIRALAGWKNCDAVDLLAEFAKNAPNTRLKVLALRAFVRLSEDNFRLTAEQKIAVLQKASAWAEREEEKQLLATALQQAKTTLENEGFVPIFNGNSLEGWHGGGGFWKAVSGVMIGQSTENHKVTRQAHLIYDKELADFELRCEFRLSRSANSGIQLRALNKEFGDTGYQADMDGGGGLAGFMYHPKQHLVGKRGTKTVFDKDGKKTVTDLPSVKEVGKICRIENWNEYRILCKGPIMTIWLNGVLMNVFEDHRPIMPAKGYVSIQIHPGPPMKLEFRNIRLKQL